jgi:nucleoside-diphosphate-sugar epimerase
VILVAGGTGFIGSHLLDRVADTGEPVRALVRRKTALPRGVEAVYGDLATGEGMAEAIRGADTIIHIAGVIRALAPRDYYRGNAQATENLARVAAGRGSRFVHVSSLAVCGPCPAECAIDEDTDPQPVSHYGKSKLEAERIVRSLLPEAVIVRPPIVYGPRDTGVFPLLKSISRGVVLQIAGGERWFSMIYVHDLVDGILAAARSPQAAGRTYFLSHPQPLNWSDLGDTAARLMVRKPRVLRVPRPVAYGAGWLAEVWSTVTRTPGIVSREKVMEATCARWVCDSRRASAELGFNAKTSLDAGLLETLAWYKEAGWVKY